MRPLMLALTLAACATPDPAGGDSAVLPNSGFSGSTGQSGTTPLTCPELVSSEPQDHPVAYDELTPLGFTVEDALAPVLTVASTLTWTADGSTTGLTGTLSVQSYGVNANFDPDTDELTACVGLTLLDQDGTLIGGFSAERVQVLGLGLLTAEHEGYNLADGGFADPDLRRRRYALTLDDGQTSGTLEEAPVDGTPPDWETIATW